LFGKQAVVIGAGIAGLAAAARLPSISNRSLSGARRAVIGAAASCWHSTGRHLHVLLMSGLRALDELFPDFVRDLEQSGRVPLTVGLDVRVERLPYDPFPQRDLGYVGYAASRAAIEHTLAQACARTEERHDTAAMPRQRTDAVAGRKGDRRPF